MPASATITAFHSFTPNTRARATQVNENFSVFRGHLIPIDPNTETAINLTYDLGSEEYRWETAYVGRLNFGPATTAGYPLEWRGTNSSYYTVYDYVNTTIGASPAVLANVPAAQLYCDSTLAFEVTKYGAGEGSIPRFAIAQYTFAQDTNIGEPAGTPVLSALITRNMFASAGGAYFMLTASCVEFVPSKQAKFYEAVLVNGQTSGCGFAADLNSSATTARVNMTVRLVRNTSFTTTGAEVLHQWTYWRETGLGTQSNYYQDDFPAPALLVTASGTAYCYFLMMAVAGVGFGSVGYFNAGKLMLRERM